jgi:hypothetical protein
MHARQLTRATHKQAHWVVHEIVKGLKRGSKGGSQIRWDGGLGEDQCRHTVSGDMIGGDYLVSIDERGVECTSKSPDNIMIDKSRAHDWNSARARKLRGSRVR